LTVRQGSQLAIPARIGDDDSDRYSVLAPPARQTVAPVAVVVVSYFIIGCAAFWPVVPGFSHHLLSRYNDLGLTSWFIGWVPHALLHGQNPFFSRYLFVPDGVNLAQNTEAPLLGLVMAPVTLMFGPVVSTNLLMVFSMPLSATAAFVVLRKWRVWIPAAALGGLLYGFSPFMLGQADAHPVFIFAPLPPFIALTVANIIQRRGSPRRLGLQLGLLVSAQYLIDQEIVATVALLTCVAIVCVLIRGEAPFRDVVRNAAVPAATALVVIVVILAYPVWMLLAGPQHVSTPPWPTVNPYHYDLFSFVGPGQFQRVALGLRSLGIRVSSKTGPVEYGGYIGIPLIVLGGFFAWRSRRSPRMQLVVVLLGVSALLSLGPYLSVDGHQTRIPLPFLLLVHLPLLDNLLASRLAFETGSFLAAVIAFGLDDGRRVSPRTRTHSRNRERRIRRRSSALLAGVTLIVIVGSLLPKWPYATRPIVRLPAAVQRALPPGDPVAITYPYDSDFQTDPMIWQSEAGFPFRLLGGYAYVLAPSGIGTVIPPPMNPGQLQEFLGGQEEIPDYGPPLPLSQGLVASTRITIKKYGIGAVIVDDAWAGSSAVTALFTEALGPPKVSTGGFTMWADWADPSHP
jgi:hypothetical protein